MNEMKLCTSREDAISQMHVLNTNMQNTAFSILMFDDGQFKLYDRQSQPCYGELRKYGASHGRENCTRPDDRRPGDLKHPFPNGTPLAVGLTWHRFGAVSDQFVDVFFCPNSSPFRKGFGTFEWSYNRNGKKIGMVITDTRIDPTVTVAMMKCFNLNAGNGSSSKLKGLLDEGLTPPEALAYVCLVSGEVSTSYGTYPPDSYSMKSPTNLRRFLNGDPFDLTGGTLRDRFDYNRPQMSETFYDKKGLTLSTELNKRRGYSDRTAMCTQTWDYRRLAIELRDIFNKELSKNV